jgi:hypothetical protein
MNWRAVVPASGGPVHVYGFRSSLKKDFEVQAVFAKRNNSITIEGKAIQAG